MRRPLAFWIDVTLKAALVALLLFSVFSGLERFEGKAMAGRALTYPLAAVIVPVGWLFATAMAVRRSTSA